MTETTVLSSLHNKKGTINTSGSCWDLKSATTCSDYGATLGENHLVKNMRLSIVDLNWAIFTM